MLTNEMTDRELLELAAKAAGCVYLTNGQLYVEGKGNINWNPLTDDGDALRLAVKLKITPEQHIVHPFVKAFAKNIVGCEEAYADDPYSATRRAIVRAAAEIGRQIK